MERETLIKRVDDNEAAVIGSSEPLGALYDQTKKQHQVGSSKSNFDIVFANSLKQSENDHNLHLSDQKNLNTQKELVERFNLPKRGESVGESNMARSLSRFNNQF